MERILTKREKRREKKTYSLQSNVIEELGIKFTYVSIRLLLPLPSEPHYFQRPNSNRK